jgi:hypothetical protein
MTTTEEHINDYQLPSVLKVEVGVIELPTRIHVDSIGEYEAFTRNVTHLLALLPDEDKAAAEYSDDDTIVIHTENQAVLKYACNNYFLDDCLTTCHAVTDHLLSKFEGQVCDGCIDSFIDKALDDEYTSVVLQGGVVLKKGDL